MNLSSIKVRLQLMVAAAVLALIILGYSSVLAMKHASSSVEHLHQEGMVASNNASKVITLIDTARSELLLALQHDPDNKYSFMHNHAAIQHLDNVSDSLLQVENLIQNHMSNLELTSKQKQLTGAFLTQLNQVINSGFNVSSRAIKKGDYQQANQVFLRVINPNYEKLHQIGEEFLSSEIERGQFLYVESENEINRTATLIITIIVLSVVFLGLFAVFIVRRLAIALHEIQRATTEISNGNLTERVALGGNDELSRLAGFVDDIALSFQNVIKDMNDYSTQISSAAEEGSAVVVQTKQNIVDQQQQTQMVATAIDEFSSTVQEVANSASSAASASENTQNAMTQSMTVVHDTIDKINELDQEMSETTTIIQQLSEHSTEIGGVIDVIDSISEQTNLLALNAAIEAARAGEAGRGFAVVADEVRSLASRTQESTEEIKVMISKLQESSKKSLEKMEHGTKVAQATVAMAQEAGTTLNSITEHVDNISNLNIQIATAAEQQSVVTDEINQNISTINDISTQTASGAEQSSDATMKLVTLTNHIKENVAQFSY